MRTVNAILQDAHRRRLKDSHALRGGLVRAALRHRRWIWATRLHRWSGGRLGRPAGPPRRRVA